MKMFKSPFIIRLHSQSSHIHKSQLRPTHIHIIPLRLLQLSFNKQPTDSFIQLSCPSIILFQRAIRNKIKISQIEHCLHISFISQLIQSFQVLIILNRLLTFFPLYFLSKLILHHNLQPLHSILLFNLSHHTIHHLSFTPTSILSLILYHPIFSLHLSPISFILFLPHLIPSQYQNHHSILLNHHLLFHSHYLFITYFLQLNIYIFHNFFPFF